MYDAIYFPVSGWIPNLAIKKMSTATQEPSTLSEPSAFPSAVLHRAFAPKLLPVPCEQQPPFVAGTALATEVPGVMEEVADQIKHLDDQDHGSLEYITPLGLYPQTQKTLRGFAEALGFAVDTETSHRRDDLVPLNGSVQTHVDDGLGWYLSWVLHADEPKTTQAYFASEKCPELVAVGGHSGMTSLILPPGSLFAFNASRWHGWIFNGGSMLAQVPLKVELK